jgi:hypothetical protein
VQYGELVETTAPRDGYKRIKVEKVATNEKTRLNLFVKYNTYITSIKWK